MRDLTTIGYVGLLRNQFNYLKNRRSIFVQLNVALFLKYFFRNMYFFSVVYKNLDLKSALPHANDEILLRSRGFFLHYNLFNFWFSRIKLIT